ncbi:MAG TPA: tRNA lysidine(34) synthetase TilS [Jatrophihabitans sp.]|nr:tRNA lysidine(34) synthetase TilS [Jatrophihabitans sp.]
MGPAPAVAAVRSAVRAGLRDCSRVLVACSGGADSLALAAATAFEAARAGVPAGLITVDHGLQDGSAAHARHVATIGYELGLDPVEVIAVHVGATGGPEGAARDARYAALDSAASALDAHILLGHTLDDQAETVLLGLGRGSGPRSIAGMAAVDGRYLRPFLGLRRATTEAACAALGLAPWADPHNIDPAYQRVRLRREVLPLLEDVLQGGVAEALARTAGLLRDDVDALDALARELVQPLQSDGQLDVKKLAELPRALRTRVLRLWADDAGVPSLTAERTAALEALVTDWHGQGPVYLPGGVAAHRVSGKLKAYAAD